MSKDLQSLAHALEALASSLEKAPRSIIGLNVSATGAAGGGNVVGMSVTAVGGAGSGSVTGLKISVSDSGKDPASGLISELREAALAVKEQKAARSWLSSILDRVRGLADRAVDAALIAAVEQGLQLVS